MFKRLIWLAVFLAIACAGEASNSALDKGFQHPPDSARPWVFWFWLNGNINSNAITADLEAMKQAGIGGVAIMDVDQGAPKGPVEFGTLAWVALFKHMCGEAARLGLQVNMNNDAGWSGSGGPWITPALSMQKLAWTETTIKGPRHFERKLPQPPAVRDYYKDIAVFAFPASDAEAANMRDAAPKITTSLTDPNVEPGKLIDREPNTALAFPRPVPGKTHYIQLQFTQPFSARRLLMTLPGISAHKMCHGELQVSDDGQAFRTIREFDAEAPAFSLNFNEVAARYFRIRFLSAEVYLEQLNVAEVELSPLFRIENIEEKSLFVPKKESPGKPDNIAFPEGLAVGHERILTLTSQVDAVGNLSWDAPAGNWTVLRFGHTSTGEDNQPAPEKGRGLECDKMSKEAAEAMFNGLMGRLISAVGPLAGKTFVATHIDSWEVSAQNWTPKFAEEFKQRRGYDPLPFLPIITGRVVDSLEVSERFLWDLRQTVSDLIVENYAGHFQELARRHGMRLTIEAYDLNPCEDLRYASRADEPMAEFWTWPSYAVAYSCIEMPSAAHVYGKKIVGGEAFTATDAEKWLGHPFAVKVFGDWGFCHGINRFVLHRYALQPWTNPERRPGMSMGPWGLHYERTQTWWDQVKPWHEYLSRCQYLLQQGLFVADICYLAPEESPQRWQPPDKSKERPGYNFDGCPAEVVLTRMGVKDGRIVLPDGMSYRLLVLPESKTMTPRLLGKIKELVEAGATIVGPPPMKSPSLLDFPKCDADVQQLAKAIWGDCDGKAVKEHVLGKGRVIWGKTPQKVLSDDGVPPDFLGQTVTSTQAIRYIHKTLGDTDVYFLANKNTHTEEAVGAFRVQNKRPELWRPDTGRMEAAVSYDEAGGTVRVPIHFDPNGSVFVIFRAGKPVEGDRITSVSRDGKPMLETAFKPEPAGGPKTNEDMSITFTMMAWAKPEVEIDLPEEANAGIAGLHVYRNDALFPPPGQDVYEQPLQAGAGISIGLNGVCVFEHSDNYFASPLVYSATITNWTHIAIVYRQNRPSLYLNGKPVHEGKQSTFTVHSGVGVQHRRGVGPFWGELGKFEKFDRALSGEEITRAMESTPVPEKHPENESIRLMRKQRGTVTAEIWEPGNYEAKTGDGRVFHAGAQSLPSPLEITGPWQVRFQPKPGAPERITLPGLISWSEHENPGVKYFSGSGTYEKEFELPGNFLEKGNRLYLSLGKVAVMAQVLLNGKELGTLWKPPFQLDISGAAKSGRNKLEIKVVNLWVNRMIGDEQLPEDSDRTEKGTLEKWPQWLEKGEPSPTGRYSFTTWRLWKKDSTLRQSGLLGPVRIIVAKEISFPIH
jgi:hypothetical protein